MILNKENIKGIQDANIENITLVKSTPNLIELSATSVSNENGIKLLNKIITNVKEGLTTVNGKYCTAGI